MGKSSMYRGFDKGNEEDTIDSSIMSSNGDLTHSSFLSMSSYSSASSIESSCYQNQSVPASARDSVDFTDYSLHQHQIVSPATNHTHSIVQPDPSTTLNHSYAYSNRRTNRSYNCYKTPSSLQSPLSSVSQKVATPQYSTSLYKPPQYQTHLPRNHSHRQTPQPATPPQQSAQQPSVFGSSTGNSVLGSLSHINNKTSHYNSLTYIAPTSSSTSLPSCNQSGLGSNQSPNSVDHQNTTTLTTTSAPTKPMVDYPKNPSSYASSEQSTDDDQRSFKTTSSQKVKSKSSWRNGLKGLRKSQSIRSSVDETPQETAAAAQSRRDRFAISPQSTVSSRYSNSTAHSYGLVSRSDDTRLRDDSEARQSYFESIQIRFLVYCSLKSPKHLRYAMSITPSQNALAKWETAKPKLMQDPTAISLGAIEMSLRQLREAVLTLTSDDLTIDIYVYSVKASAMEGHHEAYLPSCQHILNTLHPEVGLPQDVFTSVFEIYILHLIHFNNDTVQAFDLLGEYYSTDHNRLWETARYWVERDYVRWRRVYDSEQNMASKRVMQMGELTIANEALARIGSSYMTISQPDLEGIMSMPWTRIVNDLHCPWRNDNGTIVIKERKR